MLLKIFSLAFLAGLSLQTSPVDIIADVEDVNNDLEEADLEVCTFKDQDMQLIRIRYVGNEEDFVILEVDPVDNQRTQIDEEELLRECFDSTSSREGRRRKSERRFRKRVNRFKSLRATKPKRPLLSPLFNRQRFSFNQPSLSLSSNPLMFGLGNTYRRNPFSPRLRTSGLMSQPSFASSLSAQSGRLGTGFLSEPSSISSFLTPSERLNTGLQSEPSSISSFLTQRGNLRNTGFQSDKSSISALRDRLRNKANKGSKSDKSKLSSFSTKRGRLRNKSSQVEPTSISSTPTEVSDVQSPPLPSPSSEFDPLTSQTTSTPKPVSRKKAKPQKTTSLRRRNDNKDDEKKKNKNREEARKEQEKRLQENVKQLEDSLDKKIRAHKEQISNFHSLHMLQPMNRFGGSGLFGGSNFGLSQYRSIDE